MHSDIPTLIVTGQYDPPTPPAYGRLAAATLTRSYLTEFPGLAHIPRNDACVDDVESAFVHQPLQRPDTSCIQQMPPISWKPDRVRGPLSVFKTGKETRLTCRDAPPGRDLGTYSA